MQLTTSQRSAVEQLTKHYKDICENQLNGHDKNIYFKAPTGSGKTFIASKLIANILEYENFDQNSNTIIIVATISNADLPGQFASKLKDYQKYNDFNHYKIEHLESPSVSKTSKYEDYKGFRLENNKIFVLGTSPFGRNTIFYQNDVLKNLIQECLMNCYNIIFIRDEAHIGYGRRKKIGERAELKRFDDYMEDNAKFILRMTATPPSSDNKLVEISEDDLRSDDKKLLKDEPKRPPIKSAWDSPSDEDVLLQAINQFKKIKKQYEPIRINPAILIQIDNDSNKDAEIRNRYLAGLELIERTLQKHNLFYLKYLDKKEVIGTKCPPTLKYASQNNSILDVIIFKIGPATGWDIPRANMLIQLRSVSSETLNIQTIGRIRRNPFPNLEYNPTTAKCFLYSNYRKGTRDIAYYKLQKKFKQKRFYKGEIDNDSEDFDEDIRHYKTEVKKFIHSNKFTDLIKVLDIEEDIIKEKTTINDTEVANRRIHNYVWLKIDNLKKWSQYEKTLHLNSFKKDIEKISENHNANLEIVKNLLIKNVNKLYEIKNKYTTFFQKTNNYKLKYKAKLSCRYSIWISEYSSEFSSFDNYGYIRITNNDLEKDKQYLDSEPELRFMKLINRVDLIKKNFNNIKFYAKMPVFGSGVFLTTILALKQKSANHTLTSLSKLIIQCLWLKLNLIIMIMTQIKPMN